MTTGFSVKRVSSALSLFLRPPGFLRPSSHVGVFAVICATVLAALFFGYEAKRALQVFALFLPGAMVVFLPLSGMRARLAYTGLFLWSVIFITDGVVRGVLDYLYDATPDSSLVISALAATRKAEVVEFMISFAVEFSLVGIVLAAVLYSLFHAGKVGGFRPSGTPLLPISGKMRVVALGLLALLMTVSATGYALSPWRKHHPVTSWIQIAHRVEDMRSELVTQKNLREKFKQRAISEAPAVRSDVKNNTVVLVISESINRDNMSLYGYPRDTTPELRARKKAEGDSLLVFRHAWSTKASTLPALESFFFFGRERHQAKQHLLALARAAGYRIWWVTNQDDIFTDEYHARYADYLREMNRTPGRSSMSMDEVLLKPVEEALADPAPLKLIVVHMIGAHPHYELRFPQEDDLFNGTDDVQAVMKQQGRSPWVRELRDDYDTAMLYQDQIVSRLFDMTSRLPRASTDLFDQASFIYFSDHGQEVGHTRNRAGHSPSTPAGYKVPVLIWDSNDHFSAAELEQRSLRTDWLGYTVLSLMGVEWKNISHDRDVLAGQYKWQTPVIPAQGVTFVD